MYRGESRRKSVALWIAVIGSFIAVGALASPVSALHPGTVSYPPYPHAASILHHWANVSGAGTALFKTFPAVKLLTGQVLMAMAATQASAAVSRTSSAVAISGFGIPFTVNSTGAHTVTVNWSFGWIYRAAGSYFCGFIYCPGTTGIGSIVATAYLEVVYAKNGSVVLSSTPTSILSVSTHSAKHGTGYYAPSLSANGTLVSGQKYTIKTYIEVAVSAWAAGGKSSAFFGMASPNSGYYGDLNPVWIL
jgi:hypothetical protein